MGRWSVIVPEATDNLITNPSVETDTTGWTAVGGSVARSALYSVFGLYSLAVTPTAGAHDGVYFGTVALTVGTTYTFSVYVRGVVGVSYRIYFADAEGNVEGTAVSFVGDGGWHRYQVTWECDGTASYRLYVVKNNNVNTSDFYLDAAQCEAGNGATTYCDGSIDPPRGFSSSGCYWNGVAHASMSSRVATTRAGGWEVNLEDEYGFLEMDDLGTGAPDVDVITTAYLALPGSFHDRTVVLQRSFTVLGTVAGASLGDLQRKRGDLISAMYPEESGEPVLLRYDGEERKLEIAARYRSGLSGGQSENFVEKLGLQFVAPYPYWREMVGE